MTDSSGTFLEAKDTAGEINTDNGKMFKVSSKESVSIPQGFEDVYWNENLVFNYSEIFEEKRLELGNKDATEACEPINLVKNDNILTVNGIKYGKAGCSINKYPNASFTATFNDKTVVIDNIKNFPDGYNPAGTYTKYIRSTPWKSIDGKDMNSDDNNPNKNPDTNTCTLSELKDFLESASPRATPYSIKLSGSFDFSELKKILLNVENGVFINLELPDTVTIIPQNAFYNIDCLKNISIPTSVTEINHSAFSFCTFLEKIYIPCSVTYLDHTAFEHCWSLKEISVDKNNTVYDSRNNCNAIIETEYDMLFTACENTTIPDSVLSIEGYAFSNAIYLEELTIPQNIILVGFSAIKYCDSLNKLTFENTDYWYATDHERYIGQKDKTNCTLIDVSNPEKNALLFIDNPENYYYLFKLDE